MNFVLVVIFLVLAFIIIFLYAKLDEKIKKISGKGFVEDIRKEIEGLIVEFNKVSNKKIIVIDEKVKEIEKLLKLADERILKLDAMTRSYNEVIKRYELLKSEIEKMKLEHQSISLDKGTIPTIPPQKTSTEKETMHNQNRTKRKVKSENLNKKLPEMTVFDIVKSENEKLGKIVKKVKNHKEYNVDSMDFSERARLLENLIYEGLTDDELIEIGFTQSEIDMAKAVLKVSK